MSDQSNPATEAVVAVTPEITLAEELPDFAELLPASLLPAWQLISQHPLLAALLVTVVSYVVAISCRSLLVNLLGRLTGLTKSSIADTILQELRKPVFNTILFFGLSQAIVVAQLPFGGEIIINLLISIIVASWIRASVRISTLLLEVFSQDNRLNIIETRTVPIFDLSSKLVIIMVGSYLL